MLGIRKGITTFARSSKRIIVGLANEATQQLRLTKQQITGQMVLQWTVGIVVSTPIIATIQGIVLLSEYRILHANAPRPVMPSRGVILVEDQSQQDKTEETNIVTTNSRQSTSSTVTKTSDTNTLPLPPLRVLVIGDSLAAGVGMSNSGTPALPESIAISLSNAFGGKRVIYWTCVGTPGTCLSQIIQEIHQLEVTTKQQQQQQQQQQQSKLSTRATGGRIPNITQTWQQVLSEWRQTRAKRRQERQAQEQQEREQQEREQQGLSDKNQDFAALKLWWRQNILNRGKNDTTSKENDDMINKKSSKQRQNWWTRFKTRALEDIEDIKEIVEHSKAQQQQEQLKEQPQKQQQQSSNDPKKEHKYKDNDDDDDVWFLKNSLLKPEVVGEFDIAIVLTGLNDLKEGFMPMLVAGGRTNAATTKNDAQGERGGLFLDLRRMLDALKYKMVHDLEPQEAERQRQEQQQQQQQQQNGQGNEERTVPMSQMVLNHEKKQHENGSSVSPNAKLTKTTGSNANDERVSSAESEQFLKDSEKVVSSSFSFSSLLSWAFSSSSDASSSVDEEQGTSQQQQLQQRHDPRHPRPPLVVIPALPIAPLELFQVAPIKWFLKPLFAAMEHNKRVVSERFPDSVLFIEQPPPEFWMAIERHQQRQGHSAVYRLGERIQLEQDKILYKITDVKEHAKERIQKLMKQHYETNDHSDNNKTLTDSNMTKNESATPAVQNSIGGAVTDAKEPPLSSPMDFDEDYQLDDADWILPLDEHHHHHSHRYLPHQSDYQQRGLYHNSKKSPLVAVDNMHPNDDGYEIWGRHIAAAIVRQWKEQEKRRKHAEHDDYKK